MTSSRNMVLIHGAWQGSWAFAAWTPLLQARGWKVLAVNLPGNDAAAEDDSCANLDGYTAHVLRVLESLDDPAVVVGHSGGGMTASQVAQAAPERVSALVYLAGMMLPSGMSYGDVIAQCRAVGVMMADMHLAGDTYPARMANPRGPAWSWAGQQPG